MVSVMLPEMVDEVGARDPGDVLSELPLGFLPYVNEVKSSVIFGRET